MARYSLILKDETYAKLLLLAAREKMTLGKFLNKILEEFVAVKYNAEKKEAQSMGRSN